MQENYVKTNKIRRRYVSFRNLKDGKKPTLNRLQNILIYKQNLEKLRELNQA